MTDESTRTPMTGDTQPPATAASNQTAPARPPRQPGRGKAALFFDLVFNLAVVGSVSFMGYMLYEQDKAIDVLFGEQNTLSTSYNAALSDMATLRATNASLQQEMAGLRTEAAGLADNRTADLDALRSELANLRLGLGSGNAATSQELLLAEAASLLRLAQQHLIVAHDLRTAQALYLAADDILRQIDDAAIYAVRETLAGELAAIRAVPEVDVAAIYLQIGAVAGQVMRLQVNNNLATQVAEGERVGELASGEEDNAGLWSQLTGSVRSAFNNYLVVRRRDAPLQALMTPDQEAAVMQTAVLYLEQARTALLRGDQEIYAGSLGNARSTIATWLGGDAGVKAAALSSLDALQGRRITSDIPPLGRTRAALDNILAGRRQQDEQQ